MISLAVGRVRCWAVTGQALLSYLRCDGRFSPVSDLHVEVSCCTIHVSRSALPLHRGFGDLSPLRLRRQGLPTSWATRRYHPCQQLDPIASRVKADTSETSPQPPAGERPQGSRRKAGFLLWGSTPEASSLGGSVTSGLLPLQKSDLGSAWSNRSVTTGGCQQGFRQIRDSDRSLH